MCKKKREQRFQDFGGEKKLKKIIDISIDNIIKIILKFIFKEHTETLWNGPILIIMGNSSDPF